jgi:integrase
MARGNGEGTIVKRKDGRWMGAVTVGTDPETGKPDRKFIYGKKRKEVARKMTELKQKLFDGSYVKQSEIKLGEWLTRWNEGRKSQVAYKTYRSYKIWMDKHIIPELGDVKLKDLKARQIQNLLNKKIERRSPDNDKGLSVNSVKHIYATIHTALNQAVKEQLIVRNVAASVSPPKKQEEKKLQTWTKEEVNKFLAQAKKHKYFIIYYLAVNTGMRRGELIGLKWSDIDFKKKRLEVNRQVQRTDEGLIFKQPKSKAGYRVIPITTDVVKQLKKQKIRQSEKKLALGSNYNGELDLICSNMVGNPIEPTKIYKYYKEISRAADLPEIRFHDLRHTFATLFLQSNGNIKTLQQILGHSSISVTMDTYSHVTDEMLDSAAKNIEMMYKANSN